MAQDKTGIKSILQSSLSEEDIAIYLIANEKAIKSLFAKDKQFKIETTVILATLGRAKKMVALVCDKLDLISHKPTWSGILVGLRSVFNPSEKNKILRNMLLQVIFITLFFGNAMGYEIQQREQSILLKSDMPTIHLQEKTEEYTFGIYDNFMSEIEQIEKEIEKLKMFKQNSRCQTEALDDLFTVLESQQFKKGLVHNILIHHSERDNKHKMFKLWISSLLDKCEFTLNAVYKASLYQIPTGPTKIKEAEVRKTLINNFKDETSKCLVHGMYPNKYFEIIMITPTIYDCSLMCLNRHLINRNVEIQQIIKTNKVKDCKNYAYKLSTKECYLSENIPHTVFRSLNDYSGDNADVLSGKYNCQFETIDRNPKIEFNQTEIPMLDMCLYTPKEPKHVMGRCLEQYYSLKIPLVKIKLELKSFKTIVEQKLNPRKNRGKRSLLTMSAQAVSYLAGQFLTRSTSDLQNQIIINVSNNTVLIGINNALNKMGIESNIVHNYIPEHKSNISALAQTGAYLKLKNSVGIKVGPTQILHVIQKAELIKNHYRKILRPLPLKNETQEWLKESNYLCRIFINGNKIVKKFLMEVQTGYTATMANYIPINTYFYDIQYWQSHTFLSGKTSACLSSLLAGSVQYCQAGPTTRKIITDNVFYVDHIYETTTGKILVVNRPGLIEITCLRNISKIITTIKSLTLITVTDDCKGYFEGLQILESSSNKTGITPKIIFQGKNFVKINNRIDWHKIGNSAILGSGCLIGLIIICIKVGKQPTRETNKEITEEQELCEY